MSIGAKYGDGRVKTDYARSGVIISLDGIEISGKSPVDDRKEHFDQYFRDMLQLLVL